MWDETLLIMRDLFENVWGDQPEVVVDHCVDVTLPVSASGPSRVDASVEISFFNAVINDDLSLSVYGLMVDRRSSVNR